MQRRGAAASPRNTATATNFLYLGRQYNFPDGPGRGAEAQGNQLHPRRGLPGRRNEARADRPGRRAARPACSSMPHGVVYDKVMSNMEEIKARGGPVIAIVDEGDTQRRPSWPTT